MCSRNRISLALSHHRNLLLRVFFILIERGRKPNEDDDNDNDEWSGGGLWVQEKWMKIFSENFSFCSVVVFTFFFSFALSHRQTFGWREKFLNENNKIRHFSFTGDVEKIKVEADSFFCVYGNNNNNNSLDWDARDMLVIFIWNREMRRWTGFLFYLSISLA